MSKIEKTRDGLYSLDGGDGAALTIGDPAGSRVTPRLRAEKWGGRAWQTVIARDVAPDVAAEKIKKIKGRDCLEIECVRTHKGGAKRGEVHRIYEPASPTEWDIEWQSFADVPADGLVEFDVGQPAGLDWHYQPALSPLDVLPSAMSSRYRPPEVEGSYAVYWRESGRILRADGTERVNFETGKFCHVYRPVCIDAAGNRKWASMSYAAGVLTVTLPLAWLAAATFPVVLDPTFGYASKGGSSLALTSNYMTTTRHQSTTAGSATGMSYYTSGTSRNFILALYAAKAGELNKPYSLLAQTASGIVGSTEGWTTSDFAVPYDIEVSTYYHLGQNHDGGNATFWYDSVANFFYDQDAEVYAGVPSPFASAANLDNYKISAYVTYTESAAGYNLTQIGSALLRRHAGLHRLIRRAL